MDIRCNNCFEVYDSEYDMCPFCGYCKGDPAQEAFFLTPGTVLSGRYTIGKSLGFGGFGIIYKAWDNQLESAVAIKEFYPSGIVNRAPGTCELILCSNDKRQEFDFGLSRFISEARNTTKFNAHENIVNVYEYFEENNTAYFVMEYLQGCNLKKYMDEHDKKLSQEESISIVLDVCNALKDVHSSGIIHRDISPDNIYLCKNGTIKLIDFGAARFSSEYEENRTIILKPGYAPAEQYEQVSTQGPKTDIYALGATMYYMITGVEPDESTNRKVEDNLEEPNQIDETIPQFLNDTILRAMAMEPSLRFENIEEFEKALKEEIKVMSPIREKKKRKRKRLIGISCLSSVLIFIAVIFGLNVSKKAELIKLEKAEISVWYAAETDTPLDKAYRSVIGEFSKEYENVKITIKNVEPINYDYELSEAILAGKTPSLFMTDKYSTLNLDKTYDLKTTLFPENQGGIYFLINKFLSSSVSDYYFLADYEKMFPKHQKIPYGFNAPVFYVNSSKVKTDNLKALSGYNDIAEYIDKGSKLLIDETTDEKVLSLLGIPTSANIVRGSVDDFTTGGYEFFISDTSNYFAIRKMPSLNAGIPKLYGIQVNNIPCSFERFWSIGKGTDNENAAASRLLLFMLSANAQSNLYGRSDCEKAMPINKEALKSLTSVYEELDVILGTIKECEIK